MTSPGKRGALPFATRVKAHMRARKINILLGAIWGERERSVGLEANLDVTSGIGRQRRWDARDDLACVSSACVARSECVCNKIMYERPGPGAGTAKAVWVTRNKVLNQSRSSSHE